MVVQKMISLLGNKIQQKALFHIIRKDDISLLNTADAEWFRVLYHLPWNKYREFAAQYYNLTRCRAGNGKKSDENSYTIKLILNNERSVWNTRTLITCFN